MDYKIGVDADALNVVTPAREGEYELKGGL